MNNKYNYTPRRRRVGPRGAATWPKVPRRIHVAPRGNKPLFALILIILINLNQK